MCAHVMWLVCTYVNAYTYLQCECALTRTSVCMCGAFARAYLVCLWVCVKLRVHAGVLYCACVFHVVNVFISKYAWLPPHRQHMQTHMWVCAGQVFV